MAYIDSNAKDCLDEISDISPKRLKNKIKPKELKDIEGWDILKRKDYSLYLTEASYWVRKSGNYVIALVLDDINNSFFNKR